VRITDAAASNAQLAFEWDEEERFNWDFDPDNAPSEQPLDALPLLLQKARIDNVRLAFSHPTLIDTLVFDVVKAVHAEDSAHNLVLDAELLLEDRPITLTGSIGPFPELAVAGDVNFDLLAEGPIGHLNTVGSFDWLARVRNPDLTVSLESADSTVLLNRLKLPEITTGPASLQFTVSKDDDKVRASAYGELGEFQIDGALRINSLVSYEGFQLELNSNGPSIAKLFSLAGIEALTDHPYDLNILAVETPEGIDLQEFNFITRAMQASASGILQKRGELRDMTLQLNLEGDDIRDVAQIFDLDAGQATPYKVRAAITGEDFGKADTFTSTLSLGQINGEMQGTLGERWDFINSEFDYQLETPDLVPIVSLFGLALTDRAPAKLSGNSRWVPEGLTIDEMQLSLATTTLSANGIIYAGGTDEAFDLQANWGGGDLEAALNYIEFVAAFPMPAVPFSTDAQLRLKGPVLHVNNADSTVGRNTTRLDGSIDFSGETPEFSVSLKAEGDDLAEFLSGTDLLVPPARPFKASAELSTAADELRISNFVAELAKGQLTGNFVAGGDDYNRLQFDVSASGPDIAAVIPEQETWQPAAVPFELELQGMFSDDLIDLDKGKGKLGSARFKAQGEIELEPQFKLREIQFDGSGPSLDELGTIADWDLPEQPFSIKTGVSGDVGKNRLNSINLQIGESNIDGNIQVFVEERVHFDIDVDSDKLNLDKFRLADYTQESDSDSYFDDDELPFDFFDDFDANVDIRLANLITSRREFREVNLRASLNDGHMNLEEASLASATGRVRASGNWKPHPNGKQIELNLKAENAALALRAMSAEETADLPRFGLDARLTANGRSTRELAASADGHFWVLGGKGKIRRVQLGALMGDFFTQLANTVNPFAKTKEFNTIECQGYFFEISDGKLQTSPIMVSQSDLVVIVAQGSAGNNPAQGCWH
jgi:hypothetical protein